jgi:hypothetical protein
MASIERVKVYDQGLGGAGPGGLFAAEKTKV